MTVKERIKIVIKHYNLTVSAFEKSLNASNGYVNSISKSIGLDKITLILEKYSDLNIEWLLSGKGEMLKSRQKSDLDSYSVDELLDYIIVNKEKFRNEPKIDAVVALFSNFEQQRVLKEAYDKASEVNKLIEELKRKNEL